MYTEYKKQEDAFFSNFLIKCTGFNCSFKTEECDDLE